MIDLLLRYRHIVMIYHIANGGLEQLSFHILFHACSKQDIEPVVAEMFLQVLFYLSFDQLSDVNNLFLI
jgi:hypothetical protein